MKTVFQVFAFIFLVIATVERSNGDMLNMTWYGFLCIMNTLWAKDD